MNIMDRIRSFLPSVTRAPSSDVATPAPTRAADPDASSAANDSTPAVVSPSRRSSFEPPYPWEPKPAPRGF